MPSSNKNHQTFLSNRLMVLLKNTGDMALKRRARRIVEELDPRDGDNILDVGCGDGYYLHLLSNLGMKLKLTGTDFDPLALASAKRNLKGKNIPFVQADLMKKLPFKDRIFDKIVMSEVAEHLPNDLKGLKEVKRVLKKEGTMVLTVPNYNFPFLWDPINWVLQNVFGTHIKSGFWAGIWNQHIRLYKPEQIKNVVEAAGFNVSLAEPLTFWSLPFNHNLMHFAAKKLYGGNLSREIIKAVSKFEITSKKSGIFNYAFKFVNFVDKLNDLWTPKSWGVGIFILAKKKPGIKN